MESRNPVFNNSQQFRRGGYATFNAPTPSAGQLEDMYSAPSATSVQTGRMTIDDVVMRTAMLFAALLASAGFTYFVWKPQSLLVVVGAGLVGLVLAIVSQVGKTVRPPLMFAYAAVEGVFVGGISYWYAVVYGNQIVPQAVLGTLAAFGAMLVLYRSGTIRATPKFRRTLIIAGVGYLVFGLINLVIALTTGHSVYNGGGVLALALSGFGVVLASLFLVLDFDFIEQGVRNGLPQQYAWVAAFGLVVTLVWIYLEILRLLSILSRNN